MYITFSYLDKPTKAAAKSLSKKNKTFPIILGKERYSIIEANNHLQKLGAKLYSKQVAAARFLVMLHDSEGLVETAGTTYEFGPIVYTIEAGGLGASLVEVIQKDIYADTDENMSVEESYRNDKLIEQLDKALERENEPDSEAESLEVQPWERTDTTEIQENSLDQEIQAERLAEEEREQVEETEVPEEVEEIEPLIEKHQKSKAKGSQEPKGFFDYEEYISPISESSELFVKQDQELEKLTRLQTLLADLPEEEPWLNEKIRQYLQNEYVQSDVSNLKQVFDRTRQEALAKTRSLLAEQYRSIQEDNVEERAQGQLAASMNELNEQFSDDIQQFIGTLEEKWRAREQELLEKEAEEIERISKEIQVKYSRIKTKENEEKDEKIAQFTAEEQAKLSKEKDRLIEEEKAEIIKQHDETLTQVRIEAKKETEDHIKKVFTNAVQVIQDKNKEILATVSEQVVLWKEEEQQKRRVEEEAAEKERKEVITQQRIQLQKEKQALRKKELQLKEMELGKTATTSNTSQPQPLVVYPPANDQRYSKTDQLIEELRNEVRQLKQTNTEQKESAASSQKYRKMVNGLLISGMILGSLVIGGISAGMYYHFSGDDVKADVQTSTTISTSTESEPEFVVPEKDSNETLVPSSAADPSDQETIRIREFLFDAGNKEQLESFNNAYPTTIGDLEIAILNNHAVNALKAYEKLSDSDKKELGQAQKIAVKAYYTANNEISKAEEVK